jgi:hypothetical protein
MNANTSRVVALSCMLLSLPVLAAEQDDRSRVDSTTHKLIRQLVEQGVLTQEKAETLLRDAARPEPGVVRVPYVPETIKNEMREQIKQEVLAQAKNERWGEPGTLPDWLSRIKWDGDVRLRYEKDIFPPGNSGFTPDYQAINAAGGIARAGEAAFVNDAIDRERLRLRARLGLLAKVNDHLEAGLRLTSGSTSDPVSTNQTLGSAYNHNTIVLDRAYLRFDPKAALTFWGGKIPNPWFGTDLVWDEDLNFDGVAATFKPRLSERLTGFGTFGWFPVQEAERSTSDKYLTGVQAGFDWRLSANHNLKVGLAYYDYHHISGQRNTLLSSQLDHSAPQFVQKGNTMFDIRNDADATTELFALASEFKELNLTAAWDMSAFDPVHVVLTGDYVRNAGFDREEILQRTGFTIEPKTSGYQLKLAVGTPVMKQRADWQFTMAYKYLERDAVLDAFTDSDFHLGGTDAKGWILGGSYGLATNSWLTLRWLSADEIDGPPLAIDILQVDVNAKF